MTFGAVLQLLAALAQLAASEQGRSVIQRLLDKSGMSLAELTALSKVLDAVPLPPPGSGD